MQQEPVMPLDATSPVPLHVQLKETLMRVILKGEYPERIPSEKELMEAFAVSRTTVREAVSALVHEGVLEKIHGKGTFVSSPRVDEWLGTLRSFKETIESMGMKPGVRLLRHGVRKNPRIAGILGVSEYYYVERLRFADDKAVAIERSHYPVEIGRQLTGCDLNSVTIYDVLESSGIMLHRAEQKITAAMPSRADAKTLGIAPGTAVLAAERITWDPQHRPLEYLTSIYRADRYAFCVSMRREGKS
ncbi:MAG: GntR family transcriptional regulator [Syntrophobacteraceae bacterium]